jgi:type I restriction enzyme, R subunit
MIIDHLTQRGWMNRSLLYQSPFTDFSPRGVEGIFDSDRVTQLISILDEVWQRAAA